MRLARCRKQSRVSSLLHDLQCAEPRMSSHSPWGNRRGLRRAQGCWFRQPQQTKSRYRLKGWRRCFSYRGWDEVSEGAAGSQFARADGRSVLHRSFLALASFCRKEWIGMKDDVNSAPDNNPKVERETTVLHLNQL